MLHAPTSLHKEASICCRLYVDCLLTLKMATTCVISLSCPCRFDDLPSSGEWLANNPRLHSGDADAMEEEEEPHIGSSVPRGSPGQPPALLNYFHNSAGWGLFLRQASMINHWITSSI
jgi:hypothetical protein